MSHVTSMRVLTVATGKRTDEWVARVRACNYIEFKTSQNLPPVLKIVAQTVQLRVDIRYGTQCVHHTEDMGMRLELRVKIKIVGAFRNLCSQIKMSLWSTR